MVVRHLWFWAQCFSCKKEHLISSFITRWRMVQSARREYYNIPELLWSPEFFVVYCCTLFFILFFALSQHCVLPSSVLWPALMSFGVQSSDRFCMWQQSRNPQSFTAAISLCFGDFCFVFRFFQKVVLCCIFSDTSRSRDKQAYLGQFVF